MPLTTDEIANIAMDSFSTDLLGAADPALVELMQSWNTAQVVAYFESNGVELPRPALKAALDWSSAAASALMVPHARSSGVTDPQKLAQVPTTLQGKQEKDSGNLAALSVTLV